MGRGFINLTISIIIFTLIFVGCEKNKTPLSVTSDFDTRLVGEWMLTDSLSTNYPTPSITFYGIQITQDKNISELGIETRTGKVDTLNFSRYLELIKANDGVILVLVPMPPGAGIDTMHYGVKEKELFVSDRYGERTYERTKLGSQLTDPLSFEFTLMIDSTNFNGLEVYPYPACFASRISSTDLLVTALLFKWGPLEIRIEIEISDFIGVGTYQIPFGKGKLIDNEGDYILTYLADSTNIGTISITNYSEIENICAGIFSFDAVLLDYNGGVVSRKKLREGRFSLPIYK